METSVSKLFNGAGSGYENYFSVLTQALAALNLWLNTERVILSEELGKTYADALGEVFTLMRDRFSYESTDTLLLDIAGSGYPHGYMISRLKADQLRAEQELATIPSEMDLKRIALDSLFSEGQINKAFLRQIAERKYFERLLETDVMETITFLCGKTHEYQNGLSGITWAHFDQGSSTPALYSMTFEGSRELPTELYAHLVHVLKFESKVQSSISTLASGIDTGVTGLLPVTLKRVTLGPIFIHGATTQETLWKDMLEKYGVPGDYILMVTTDTTHASEIIHPSSLAVSFGVQKTPRQAFAIDTQCELHAKRGAYHVEQVLLLSHRLMQRLQHDAEVLPLLKSEYTLVTFDNQGVLL